MSLPTPIEYQDAIQNPKSCFSHPDLKQAIPEVNSLGLPKPLSGNFAIVFPLISGNTKWAVRCFSTYHEDQEMRYEKISLYLQQARLKYAVEFDFLKQGIKIRGKWYPILKMEWVDGDTLNRYIARNANNSSALRKLAENFLLLVNELNRCGIAHGDLQHGNIIVTNEGLRLVDYDGMFVPGLEGLKSHEIGHRNYQHPTRTSDDFGAHLDHFSSWCIYIALSALVINPTLCRLVNSADDHLLFRRQDIEDPFSSTIVQQIKKTKDGNLLSLMAIFDVIVFCSDLSQIPPLDIQTGTFKLPNTFLKTETSAPPDSLWIIDHLGQAEPLIAIPLPSMMDRIFAKLFTLFITYFFFIYFSTQIVSLIVFTIIVPSSLTFFLLILNLKFKSYNQVSDKKDIKFQIKNIKKEINSINKLHEKFTSERLNLTEKNRKKVLKLNQKLQKILLKVRSEHETVESHFNTILSLIHSDEIKLSQKEKSELANALRIIQTEYINKRLMQFPLTINSVSGIGPEMTRRLHSYGIKTAGDFSNIQIVNYGYGYSTSGRAYFLTQNLGRIHIEGIGPKRATDLLNWRQRFEQRVKNNAPNSLPVNQQNAIKLKYKVQQHALETKKIDNQNQSNKNKDKITKKYKQEHDRLNNFLMTEKKDFTRLTEILNAKTNNQAKRLTNQRITCALLERKFKPFTVLKFSKYLRRAIFY